MKEKLLIVLLLGLYLQFMTAKHHNKGKKKVHHKKSHHEQHHSRMSNIHHHKSHHAKHQSKMSYTHLKKILHDKHYSTMSKKHGKEMQHDGHHYYIDLSKINISPEKCVNYEFDCERKARTGCLKHFVYMLKRCPKACRFCAPLQVAEPECKDQNYLCPWWAAEKECLSHTKYMTQSCNKSCQLCGNETGTPLFDGDPLCPSWGKVGYCFTSDMVKKLCNHSCEVYKDVHRDPNLPPDPYDYYYYSPVYIYYPKQLPEAIPTAAPTKKPTRPPVIPTLPPNLVNKTTARPTPEKHTTPSSETPTEQKTTSPPPTEGKTEGPSPTEQPSQTEGPSPTEQPSQPEPPQVETPPTQAPPSQQQAPPSSQQQASSSQQQAPSSQQQPPQTQSEAQPTSEPQRQHHRAHSRSTAYKLKNKWRLSPAHGHYQINRAKKHQWKHRQHKKKILKIF